MKYVSIDIETTGIDPVENDIIEFAAIIDDLSVRKSLQDLPKFHRYIKKDGFYVCDSKAISMNSKIFEKINANIEDCIYINDLMYAFGNFLQNNGIEPNKYGQIIINVAGKNFGSFDYQFLKNKISKDNWNNISFRKRFIDPAILYYKEGDFSLPDLPTCVERYQNETNYKYKWNSHNALDDAMEVVKLVRHKIK